MSRLSNAIISIFRKREKRISSEQFEQAVNEGLFSDTVADAVKKNIILTYWTHRSQIWKVMRSLYQLLERVFDRAY